MPKKRITLPKDFERGEIYSVAELEEIFEKVEVTAVARDSGKKTALMSDRLDADGIRWLLDHGADVNAVDQYGNTALTCHAMWKAKLDLVSALLEHGADPNIAGSSSPLATAAKSANIEGIHVLLEAGADPLLTFGTGLSKETALDRTMVRMKHYEAPQGLEVARILVDRGATISGNTPKYLRQTMTSLRSAIANGRPWEKYLASLVELFELLGVDQPVPPRVLAPGEPITVTTEGSDAQYNELWKMLVPVGGPAESVQGEVIRIAGRVGNEILGNGGGNWNKDFDQMLQAYRAHVRTGAPLDEEDLARVDDAVARLTGGAFDQEAVDVLTDLSVAWVLRNPDRVDLPAPKYRR